MIRSPLISMAAGGDAEEAVKKLYLEQLGRPPDDEGLRFYANQIKSGVKTPQDIAKDLDRSTEGYNYDKQVITSAYGKNFGRGYDQAGLQFYMGQEDKDLMSQAELARRIQVGAKGTDVQRLKDNPTGFLEYTTDALRADPVGGGYAVDNPYVYDEQRIAELMRTGNISITPTGEYVQFVNPVTEQPVYSYYDPDTGEYIAKKGSHVLQPDRVRQAINMAKISGTISQADANRMLQAVSSDEAFREAVGADPTPDTLYNFLGDPKAYVVLDTLGAQIGEDKELADAKAEALDRQKILAEARKTTGMDIQPSMSLQEKIAAELGINYPFTEDNLTLDPLTGKKIRTFMTEQDILKNILDELGIEHDKTIISAPIDLATQPRGTTTSVVGTTGDFRGLAFPQARPTEIGETPAMLGFSPYSLTQAGSGQQKTTEPQPVIPTSNMTVDPMTGTLLGAVVGSLLPTPAGGGVIEGVTNLVDAAGNLIKGTPIDWNQSSSVQQTPGTYFGKSSADKKKHGGLATPLMKEGGMVPHFANGGANQLTLGLEQIYNAPSARGALIGALMTHLMNAQAKSQAANAYRGIDMSKVGVIPPRTTQVGPARFAPYRQYASRPEIPAAVSSPINVGALRSSQTPMTSFTPTQGMVNPLSRTMPSLEEMGMNSPFAGGINPDFQLPPGFDPNKIRAAVANMPRGIMDDDFVSRTPPSNMPFGQRFQGMSPTAGQPMADGGAAYYTYGQHVDPMDYLNSLNKENGMAYGGLAHGGLHEPHHADNAPVVEGRKDYRAGSAVTGPGDGQSDDIPAMLADGEYVFDADTVAQLGNGSTKAGSKMLDKFREEIRQHKRSAPVNKIPPPSKSPLAYLAEAQKKMKGARRG
jgi:hypothetical protein